MSFIHPDASLMGSNGNPPSSMEDSVSKPEDEPRRSPLIDRLEIKIVMLNVQVIYKRSHHNS
ncbi:GD19658 [Drosophila simulans]|uniref:GD19658 n=1 Tax=Drosophila simulans TaxID=7240 RepID=B4QVL8_DROSI|nr:GD19658 [Drosophila simulans]